MALNTESAKTEKGTKVDGVLRDVVVRRKKRVRVEGEWVLARPRNVGIAPHALPSARTLRVKSGA